MDNVLIMQRRKSAQCVFEDSLRERNRQVHLGQAQEMVGEVFEDKHRPLRDRVLQQAEIGTAAQAAVNVLKVLEVRLGDILQYKFLVSGAGSAEVSKLDSVGS
jgi:hypothetical protein